MPKIPIDNESVPVFILFNQSEMEKGTSCVQIYVNFRTISTLLCYFKMLWYFLTTEHINKERKCVFKSTEFKGIL